MGPIINELELLKEPIEPDVNIALKKKRLALGMTQQDVAEKATISLSSYQKYESGNRNIMTASFEIVCRVIIGLGMDPTSFYWENAD